MENGLFKKVLVVGLHPLLCGDRKLAFPPNLDSGILKSVFYSGKEFSRLILKFALIFEKLPFVYTFKACHFLSPSITSNKFI